MSGETRPGFPGWCCRQIAAQLSQALFTMADLHAQVSDLREENRQLKIKIETVDLRRTVEDNFCTGNVGDLNTSKVQTQSVLRSQEDCDREEVDLRLKGDGDSHDENLAALDTSSSDGLPSTVQHGSSSRTVVLNVPLKHKIFESKWDVSPGAAFHLGGDFKCDKCESSFPNSDLLTLHQAVHISRSFHVCKICNAMFLLKADLYRHWASHPNIKQHVCHLCGKAYTSKNNYKLHIKTHTGVGLFPCEVCGKAFHSENHLNVHTRIHTGERPFVCQYCSKSFTQKSGLINHTRLHTGEKPFLCPSCPKAFTQKSNLNFHLSKHHPPS